MQLYDVLLRLSGSPVIAVNRALAIAELNGPEVALEELKKVADDARLSEYQPYWATRAELSPEPAQIPKPETPTKWRSVSNATTPSDDSCVSGRQH